MALVLDRVSVVLESQVLLRDISCELRDGEITLLVGQTGSGKSTLLRVLAGLVEPASGRLAVGRGASAGDCRIGYAMQYPEHQLFASSVAAEFAYSLRQAGWKRSRVARRTQEACEAAGLPEAIRELSPYVLSGGEKRKVALAALFSVGDDWLLLDEPTAALDGPGVRWLTGVLRERRGIAPGGIVVATHDLDAMLPLADRVLVLQGGRIAADLTPAELCRKPEVLLQARVGLPACLRLAAALARAGVAVAAEPIAAGDMAAAVAAAAQACARGVPPARAAVGAGAAGAPAEQGAAPGARPAKLAEGEPAPRKRDASDSLSPVPAAVASPASSAPMPTVSGAVSPLAGIPSGGDSALAFAPATAGESLHAPVSAFAGYEPASGESDPGNLAPLLDGGNAPSGDASAPKSGASGAAASLPASVPLKRESGPAPEGSPAGGFAALVRRLDPRAKWLCYTLLSAGLLLQQSAAGLAAATLVTAAVAALTRTPWQRIARFAKPFAWFMALSVLVAGIRFGYLPSTWPIGLSFSPAPAWNTFIQLYKIALVMALGVTLSETVPHAEFRQALDYVLTRLPGIKRYAQPLSLAAELLLKFIPIIIGEVSRLTMAVKARRPFRQRGARKPIRPRELPVLTVPLLLSVMQRADDLSTAMEHRGFSPEAANANSRTSLQLRRADYIAILIGVILLIISIGVSYLPQGGR